MPDTPERRYDGRWRVARLSAALLLIALSQAGCRPPDPASTSATRNAPSRADVARNGPDSHSVRTVRVVRVQDGDSLIARDRSGQSLTIRLSGIDAPERSQPHADASRRHLAALLDRTDVEIRPVKTDAYDRMVAQVLVSERGALRDAGLVQIDAGMAWYFRRYAGDLPPADRDRYDAAEAAARDGRRGLWESASPEAPWAFRQRGGGRR